MIRTKLEIHSASQHRFSFTAFIYRKLWISVKTLILSYSRMRTTPQYYNFCQHYCWELFALATLPQIVCDISFLFCSSLIGYDSGVCPFDILTTHYHPFFSCLTFPVSPRRLLITIYWCSSQTYPHIFKRHVEFVCLLKERVCPLVIRLFSPSIKLNMPSPPSAVNAGVAGSQVSQGMERPSFPIVVRLIRIVSTILQRYLHVLTTESEIFLSILLRFLEPDKPAWHQVNFC